MPANFVAFLCGRHKKVINACRCKRGVLYVKERESESQRGEVEAGGTKWHGRVQALMWQKCFRNELFYLVRQVLFVTLIKKGYYGNCKQFVLHLVISKVNYRE